MCPSCEDERVVIEYLFNKTLLYILSLKKGNLGKNVLMNKGFIIDILVEYLDIDNLDYPDDLCDSIGLEYTKIVTYNQNISISIYDDEPNEPNIALKFYEYLLTVLKENNATYLERKFSDNKSIIIERIGYLYNEDYDEYLGVIYSDIEEI